MVLEEKSVQTDYLSKYYYLDRRTPAQDPYCRNCKVDSFCERLVKVSHSVREIIHEMMVNKYLLSIKYLLSCIQEITHTLTKIQVASFDPLQN